MNTYEEWGYPKERIQNMIAKDAQQPWDDKILKRIRRGFQRTAYLAALRQERYSGRERIREQMKRWKIRDEGNPREAAPAFVASRVERHVKDLANLVAPRVHAAAISTIFNRWTTARRFQKRGCISNQCWLVCDAGCEDSIEHSARCSVLQEFGKKVLDMGTSEHHIGLFTLAASTCNDAVVLTKVALLLDSAYTVTNSNRAKGVRPITKKYSMDALKQASIRAVAGYLRSTRLLDNIFARN